MVSDAAKCECCGRCRQLCLVICGSVPSDSSEPLKPILLEPAGWATFTFSQLGISGTLQAQRWKEFTSSERARAHKHTTQNAHRLTERVPNSTEQ